MGGAASMRCLRASLTECVLSLFLLHSLTADGWANDWPDWLNIVGLPDIRVFPADDRRASVRYSGPRNASALVSWLRDKAYGAVVHAVLLPLPADTVRSARAASIQSWLGMCAANCKLSQCVLLQELVIVHAKLSSGAFRGRLGRLFGIARSQRDLPLAPLVGLGEAVNGMSVMVAARERVWRRGVRTILPVLEAMVNRDGNHVAPLQMAERIHLRRASGTHTHTHTHAHAHVRPSQRPSPRGCPSAARPTTPCAATWEYRSRARLAVGAPESAVCRCDSCQSGCDVAAWSCARGTAPDAPPPRRPVRG